MARVIVPAAIILALLAFAGYLYHHHGHEYELRISEAQIRDKLAEKLPRTKTYLYVFQLTLSNPRVALLADSGRIRAGLDLQLNLLIGGHEPLSGSVDVSGRLRYAPDEGQFYLAEPQIEQLQLRGLPEKYADKARAVIATAMTEYYANHPIYRLKAGDIKQSAARLVLKDVSVSGDTLVVTLGI